MLAGLDQILLEAPLGHNNFLILYVVIILVQKPKWDFKKFMKHKNSNWSTSTTKFRVSRVLVVIKRSDCFQHLFTLKQLNKLSQISRFFSPNN